MQNQKQAVKRTSERRGVENRRTETEARRVKMTAVTNDNRNEQRRKEARRSGTERRSVINWVDVSTTLLN